MDTRLLGSEAEHFARQFLQNRGLKFANSNYACRYGEIDLVMYDEDVIVFVEVRYRSHSDFGSAVESVDNRKQKKLIRAATHYLQAHDLLDVPARIDVVGIHALDERAVEWIADAIETT